MQNIDTIFICSLEFRAETSALYCFYDRKLHSVAFLPLTHEQIFFRRVCIPAERLLKSFRLSVCPSVCTHAATRERKQIILKFCIGEFQEKLSSHFNFRSASFNDRYT
jgi:hypothetical protein